MRDALTGLAGKAQTHQRRCERQGRRGLGVVTGTERVEPDSATWTGHTWWVKHQ